MERKKWTPKEEITGELLKFREKRKWQLALRRYVLEKNISPGYAFYFGLSIDQFRKWIEIQFTEELNWGNFGQAWQFEHIVPLAYFDFSHEEDLRLCWSFINIKVEKIEMKTNRRNRTDIIAARPYFEALYDKTAYCFCLKMIEKIGVIEKLNLVIKPLVEEFIIKNKKNLEIASSLTREEFNSLNMGIPLHDILLERAIIEKFG
ncbi:MAG: hypothetical protein ABI707_17235 [Ferruginibacter sp.]